MPTSFARRFRFLHILTKAYYYVFFIITLIVDMKWYPIMVSICISLLSDQLIFDKNQVGKGWTFQKIVLKQLLIHK